MQSKFEKSLVDIGGLTEYRRGTLPRWLGAVFKESFSEAKGDTAAILVGKHFASYGIKWLGEWGTAVIRGDEVFICESDALLDPICLAADLELGFVLVEAGERNPLTGFTVYFTEGFRKKPMSGQLVDAAVSHLAD